MAIGTITYAADVGAMPSAPAFLDLMTFTGDGAYATGGTAGFAATVQQYFRDRREIIGVVAQDCGPYRVAYDKANDKLKVFVAAGTEVTNATDLSGTTFRVLVFSI
jgi:hypothetical protein